MNEDLKTFISDSNIFTSRGRILIHIVKNPEITIKRLSKDLYLTKRSIWGIIGELRSLGYLIVKREDREHHYSISASGISQLKNLIGEE